MDRRQQRRRVRGRVSVVLLLLVLTGWVSPGPWRRLVRARRLMTASRRLRALLATHPLIGVRPTAMLRPILWLRGIVLLSSLCVASCARANGRYTVSVAPGLHPRLTPHEAIAISRRYLD